MCSVSDLLWHKPWHLTWSESLNKCMLGVDFQAHTHTCLTGRKTSIMKVIVLTVCSIYKIYSIHFLLIGHVITWSPFVHCFPVAGPGAVHLQFCCQMVKTTAIYSAARSSVPESLSGESAHRNPNPGACSEKWSMAIIFLHLSFSCSVKLSAVKNVFCNFNLDVNIKIQEWCHIHPRNP